MDSGGTSDVQLLEDQNSCSIPGLPYSIYGGPNIFQHKNDIIVCGGQENEKECLKLENDTWSSFNQLAEERLYSSLISIKNEVYLIGGYHSPTTIEILRRDSNVWIEGPKIPSPGMDRGCSVKISDKEFLLIGGSRTEYRILKYNVRNKKWTDTSLQLKDGRNEHWKMEQGCIFCAQTLKLP